MTSFFDAKLGEVQEFHKALNGGGMTLELLKKVGNNAKLGNIMVKALIAHLDPPAPCAATSEGAPGNPYRSSVTGDKLPPDHYRVSVTYAPLPSFAALKKEFGKDNVSVIFDSREWKKHAACKGMDETPGEKIFYVAAPPQEVLNDSEKIIAWADKLRSDSAQNGYRPATHVEAYEFQKAHPDLQRQFWIVALGSFAFDGGHRNVAMLDGDGRRRILGNGWFDDNWSSRHRFLFVRK